MLNDLASGKCLLQEGNRTLLLSEPMTASRKSIRWKGRTYQIKDNLRIRGQLFHVHNSIGHRCKQRMMAFQQLGRNEFALRTIHVLEKRKDVRRQLRILLESGCTNFPVPRVFFSHESRDYIYVVSEWVNGQSLQRYLSQVSLGRRPALSAYEAIRLTHRLVHQICTFAANGFVHGDLHPGNLIINPNRGHRLTLIDFGSSFYFSESKSDRETDGVHRIYAAPEVLMGRESDLISEQFSISLVFFRMLTGKVPYGSLGGQAGIGLEPANYPDAEKVKCDLFRKFPSRSKNLAEEFFQTTSQLNRRQRFQTAKELRDAIDSVWESVKYRTANTRRTDFLSKIFCKLNQFELFGRDSV